MTDKTKTLLDIGEVMDHADWQDYSPMGFDETDVDALLALVGDESLNQADDESSEVWAPLHAWRALGQIGSVKAVEPLLTLFDRLVDDDWALSELPQVMSMIGAPAIPSLVRYLNELEHDEFARAMAMDGMFEIAEHDHRQRDEVIRILREYIGHPDKNARDLNGMITTPCSINVKSMGKSLSSLISGAMDFCAALTSGGLSHPQTSPSLKTA